MARGRDDAAPSHARAAVLLTLCASVLFPRALAQDKNRAITKFKIRCSKYLYTLVIKDEVRTLRARDAPRRAWSQLRAVLRENACERGLRTACPSLLPLLTLDCAASPLSLRIFGARCRTRRRS